MKIKDFRKKYQEKDWRETTPQEDIMNEFYLSMKDMKKYLEIAITKYEQGEVTVEDAYELVDHSVCALIDANQLLGCTIKKQEQDNRAEIERENDEWFKCFSDENEN